MIYLDTNIVVAYYYPETNSTAAEKVIRSKTPKWISDLTEVEFISALSKKIRMKELSVEEATIIRTQFSIHLEQGIYRRLSLGPHHVRCAREFIAGFNTPLRTLDALHLAIAFTEHLRIVTTDENLAGAAKTLSVPATYLG